MLVLPHKISKETFSNQFLDMILAILDHDFFSSFSKQKFISRSHCILNDNRFFQGFQLTGEKNEINSIHNVICFSKSGTS